MSPFAYALAEWRAREETKGGRGLALAAFFLGLGAALTWLGAAALALLYPCAALLLGWASGARYVPEGRFRKLLLGSGLGSPGLALARGLESGAEALAAGLLLSPPLLLGLALGHRGPGEALFLLALFAAAFLLSGAAAFHASLLLRLNPFFPGLWFLGLWAGASSLVPALRPLSPFAQAWAALGAASPLASYLPGLVFEACLALLLLGLSGPALELARRADARP